MKKGGKTSDPGLGGVGKRDLLFQGKKCRKADCPLRNSSERGGVGVQIRPWGSPVAVCGVYNSTMGGGETPRISDSFWKDQTAVCVVSARRGIVGWGKEGIRATKKDEEGGLVKVHCVEWQR